MSHDDFIPGLTSGQAVLVYDVARYRTIKAGLLASLRGASPEAIEKASKRLKNRGWLYQLTLPNREPAYMLTRQAVLALGLSRKALKAMGRGAIVANIAMLAFCAAKKVARLTPDEVKAAYPELDHPGRQVGNYFSDQEANPPRLTWMLVDGGSAAAILVRKAGRLVTKAFRIPCLQQLMLAGQYGITIIVPNERKKWLVERVLSQRYFPNVTISVEVVPEIEPLLLS